MPLGAFPSSTCTLQRSTQPTLGVDLNSLFLTILKVSARYSHHHCIKIIILSLIHPIIRNTAIGTFSMTARIGGIAAPYIALYLPHVKSLLLAPHVKSLLLALHVQSLLSAPHHCYYVAPHIKSLVLIAEVRLEISTHPIPVHI